MTAKNNPRTNRPGYKLVITRQFDAPRELVWKAWTDPEQIKEWLGLGEDMTIESVKVDLRAGGKFRTQTKRANANFSLWRGYILK